MERLATPSRDAAASWGAWETRGVDLRPAIGVAHGFTSVGAIGFEGRLDCGAIGTVTNLAARPVNPALPRPCRQRLTGPPPPPQRPR